MPLNTDMSINDVYDVCKFLQDIILSDEFKNNNCDTEIKIENVKI